eukprot:329719_1
MATKLLSLVGVPFGILSSYLYVFKRVKANRVIYLIKKIIWFWYLFIGHKFGLKTKCLGPVLNTKQLLAATRDLIKMSIKVMIYEMQIGDTISNTSITTYNPSDSSTKQADLLDIITPKLTVITFGSCS